MGEAAATQVVRVWEVVTVVLVVVVVVVENNLFLSFMPYRLLKKHKAVAVFILIAILLVVGGVYFYYRKTSEQTREVLREEGQHFQNEGEWIRAEQKFREALALTSDPSQKAILKGVIAFNLYRNDPLGTPGREAVLLLKETISDPAVSAGIRARSINDLAFLHDMSASDNFLRNVVFSGEPYESYLKDAGGNILGAVRRLYEEADKLRPTAFSKIEIAFKYSLMLAMGVEENGLGSEEIAHRIQRYIKEAEPLMNPQQQPQNVFAYMHLMRATSLSISDMVLHNIEYSKIESEYQEALTLSQEVFTLSRKEPDNYDARQIFIKASLGFALSLASRFGEKRAGEETALVKQIFSLDPVPFYLTTLEKIVQRLPDNTYMKSAFLGLARVSPEFHTFLTKHGWKLE